MVRLRPLSDDYAVLLRDGWDAPARTRALPIAAVWAALLSGLTFPCLTAALQRQNPSCHRQPPPRRSAAAYPHLAMITASATLARPKARYKPRPRSRRRPLSATQHHPTTSLIGISWHCNALCKSVSSILTTFRHHNPLHFNRLQTYFYFNDLQEKQ